MKRPSQRNQQEHPPFILPWLVLGASIVLGLKPSGVHAVTFIGIELPDLCPYHVLTGFWCPGCGLTRSFVSMGHGDFNGAVRFNPLGPILYLALLVQIALQVVQTLRKGYALPPKLERLLSPFRLALVAGLMLLWVERLEWGVTHASLVHAGQAPPSNWMLAASLLTLSIGFSLLAERMNPWLAAKSRRLRFHETA